MIDVVAATERISRDVICDITEINDEDEPTMEC